LYPALYNGLHIQHRVPPVVAISVLSDGDDGKISVWL
jgi:hypothetical protein